MPSREVVIGSRIGLHGRPAAALVRAAVAARPVAVRIRKAGGVAVDASSILAVLSLGARGGDTVIIEADGPDAGAALDAVAILLAQDLDAETTTAP